MTAGALSLPLEGRVAAQRPGGVAREGGDLLFASRLSPAPPPGQPMAGHPPLEGEDWLP